MTEPVKDIILGFPNCQGPAPDVDCAILLLAFVETRDMADSERMPIGIFVMMGEDTPPAIEMAEEVGVDNVHALAPPVENRTPETAREVARRFEDAGIDVTTVFCSYEGESYDSIDAVCETVGLVPEKSRQKRIETTKKTADFVAEMGLDTMALHAGFISEDTESDQFAEMVEVLREVSEDCADKGLNLNLETGQESAEALLEVLDRVDMDNLGVNFDPANMVLYGSGEPLPALRKVGNHVRSCHCKDAAWSDRPGETWGEEVPLGEGDVDVEDYIRILNDFGYNGPLTIEREIPMPQQLEDMKKGKQVLQDVKKKLGIS